ncbi:MAG: ABC transporter [Mesorhizobium amorphae]|nr:MAG: ABC transporter [Mesorhizobium amorphae]
MTACSLIAASLLAGCAALPGGGPKPLDTYELSAPSLPERPSRGRTQILVADPSALQILDSQNIVISPAPGSLEYLGGAQWADRLPRVVQARLVETFQNASGFNGVGRPGQGLAIDYQLIVEVRRFEIAVNGGRSARVAFAVKLLNDRNGTVRAVRDFEATAPVSGTTNAAYVAALNSAFGEVAGEMVDWTRSRI